MQNYTPTPIDTTDIMLPEELSPLLEALAQNVHEVWAAGRIAHGWKYGQKRDDNKRKTPCLVPYNDLSEQEKDYDRATAMGTLKFIISQGFEINKK